MPWGGVFWLELTPELTLERRAAVDDEFEVENKGLGAAVTTEGPGFEDPGNWSAGFEGKVKGKEEEEEEEAEEETEEEVDEELDETVVTFVVDAGGKVGVDIDIVVGIDVDVGIDVGVGVGIDADVDVGIDAKVVDDDDDDDDDIGAKGDAARDTCVD